MEELAVEVVGFGKMVVVFFDAVGAVANNGVADSLEVDTDLVGAAG